MGVVYICENSSPSFFLSFFLSKYTCFVYNTFHCNSISNPFTNQCYYLLSFEMHKYPLRHTLKSIWKQMFCHRCVYCWRLSLIYMCVCYNQTVCLLYIFSFHVWNKGVVAFSSQGDRIALTQIEQMIDGKYVILGHYDIQADNLTWTGLEKWHGNKVIQLIWIEEFKWIEEREKKSIAQRVFFSSSPPSSVPLKSHTSYICIIWCPHFDSK